MTKEDWFDIKMMAWSYFGALIVIPLIGLYLGWFGGLRI